MSEPLRAGSSPGTGLPPLVRIFQAALIWYLAALMYLYPYGIPVAPEVNLRPTDLFALLDL